MASVGNATIRNLGRCVWQLGALHQSSLAILRRTRGRFASTEAAPSSSTSGSPPLVLGDAKINKLVDDISSLSLLQAADLVSLLKTRLNITEIALPASSVAPATAAAAPAEEEVTPAEEKPKEKTMFNVRLESFDAASKAKVIREVKATIANMNLMEAKKFAESVPQMLKENVPKEEAEKLKAAYEALGAILVLE